MARFQIRETTEVGAPKRNLNYHIRFGSIKSARSHRALKRD